jgi:hypothetical protein
MKTDPTAPRATVTIGKLRRRHTLPFPGEILVKLGDTVELGTPWARCTPGGRTSVRDLAGLSRLSAARIGEALLSREREGVPTGDLLARGRGTLLRRRDWTAAWPGAVTYVSKISGLAFFAESTDPAPLYCRLHGSVVEIEKDKHIVIEGDAAAIAVALGHGGLGFGNILVAGEGPQTSLPVTGEGEASLIVFTESLRFDWLTAFPRDRLAGVIAPSVMASEIKSRTGSPPTHSALAEILGEFPLLLTEGIGNASMPGALQRRLRAHEGRPASLVGSALPGRAEILLIQPDEAAAVDDDEVRLRIGAGRFLGSEVSLLPDESLSRHTGAGLLTPHLEVRSGDRGRLHVPGLNLERLDP